MNLKLRCRRALQTVKFFAWYLFKQMMSPFSKSHRDFKVAILYLTAEKKYASTRNFVEKYWRGLGTNQVTLICIDNFAASHPPRCTPDGVWEIAGDNTYWEFSGWKHAINSLAAIGLSPNVIVCINDACLNQSENVNRNETFYRMRYDWKALSRARSGFLGCLEVHPTHQKHTLLGHDVSSHVRSNFFALPLSLATQLEWTAITPPTLQNIVPDEYAGHILNRSNDSSKELQEFMESWITRDWHRAAQPTKQNWPGLRQKVIAILNERLLTAHVREKKYPVIDADTILWG